MSLTPHLIWKRLQVGELKPTTILIQLADPSIKYPIGVIRDVSFQVGELFIHYDFAVMEMEVDVEIPIILGGPFLVTVDPMIDVKNGRPM